MNEIIEPNESAAPRRRRWRRVLWGVLPGILTTAAFLVHSQARALDEEGAAATAFTSSFSSMTDPVEFAEHRLDVVMPRAVIPETLRDAVTHELIVQSKTLDEEEATRVAHAILEEAEAVGLSPLLSLALIRIESNYNHLAISPVGAEGLMQLMPPTAVWMAERLGMEWPEGHSFDPVLNVRLGTRYLAHLNKQFGGRLELSLTAYNRGPSATWYIYRKYGKLPAEIRDFYATKVLDKYSELKRLYGHLPTS